MRDGLNSSVLVVPVYRSEWFTVTIGANLKDPVSDQAELNLTDVYRLHAEARRQNLAISGDGETKAFQVAADSDVGRPGAILHLDCCLTFMCPDGSTIDALIIVETSGGMIDATYMMPLAPVRKKTDHTLVSIDRDRAVSRFANLGCVSFARGTRITLSDGRQVAIEDLQPGDPVLTRDHGPQPLRWIGEQTVRAIGAFAPICIAEGALNNQGPLTLAPNHRLFVYDRQRALAGGRAERMIRAAELVNGDTVVASEGGFVDYFQLIFDRHEIIYAEGIAAESVFAAPYLHSSLPAEMKKKLRSEAAAEGHAGSATG